MKFGDCLVSKCRKPLVRAGGIKYEIAMPFVVQCDVVAIIGAQFQKIIEVHHAKPKEAHWEDFFFREFSSRNRGPAGWG